jgi:parvulin-like peptidyl-prolyl isomerase
LGIVVSFACEKPPPAAPLDAGVAASPPASQPGSAASIPAGHDTSSTAISLESLFEMPKTPGEVVARVNEAEITRKDLENRLRQTQVQLRATGLPQGLTRYDVLDGALDDLIDNELDRVLAKQLDAKADPKQVAIFLEELNARMEKNPAFKAFLLRAGKDEAQRKKDAEEAVLRRAIVDKLKVKVEKELETAAKEYYEKHKRDYTLKAGVQVWRIVIKAPRGLMQQERDAARARAEEIHKKAKKDPKNFENLAKTHSEGGKGRQGGFIGFVAKGQYNENLEKVIYSGKPGQVLPLYEDAQGFQIIKTGQRREGRVIPFEEKKAEITNNVFGTVMRTRIAKERAELRKSQKVEILIPEHAELEKKYGKKGI